MTIGFVPLARPTFDVALAQSLANQIHESLTGAGFDLVATDGLVMSSDDLDAALPRLTAQPLDLLIVLQATFADSTMVTALAEAIDAPLLLWALPEERIGGRLRLNSFCGINLSAHGLRRAHQAYHYVYVRPGDPAALHKVSTLSKAGEVRRKLRTAHIGRIGENPAGFDTCRVNNEGLREQFGVQIDQIDLSDVFDAARRIDAQTIGNLRMEVGRHVTGLEAVDAGATGKTLATYEVLRRFARDHRTEGFAVRCWPEFFTEYGGAACGAMSMLTNDLIPCSCEVDVNGTLTQMILQRISGETAFGTDVVAFDTEQDVTILWHCGLAPLSMADPASAPRATIHSNRKMPLLMEFTLKPGRVTIGRLSEATGEFRLVLGKGEMIQAPPSFTGTSGTLRFDSGAASVMDTVMREGLEHHVSLVYGDHTEVLIELANLLRLPVLWL
jgi:L-fucose isomerase-like protein